MSYKLNSAGSGHAGSLIAAGHIKDSSSWSAPGADAENAFIQEHGMAEFGKWHLGVNADADPQTKAHFGFPFTSDFKTVDVRGLAACENRASGAGYSDIAARAKELFDAAKKKLGKESFQESFGDRLVTLCDGRLGLRGAIHCEVRQPGDMPDDMPMMDFIASDNSVDRYGESIDQNGWQLDNFRKNPVVPDSHDYSSVSKILGRATNVQVRDGRLTNRVEFAIVNPLGNLAYKMAQGGFIKSQSVGFIPLEWENGLGADQPARTYKKQELLEISLVAVPANPGATIGRMARSGALSRREIGELADYLKQFCSGPAATHDDSSNTGPGGNDVRLLHLARDLGALISKK